MRTQSAIIETQIRNNRKQYGHRRHYHPSALRNPPKPLSVTLALLSRIKIKTLNSVPEQPFPIIEHKIFFRISSNRLNKEGYRLLGIHEMARLEWEGRVLDQTEGNGIKEEAYL
ncbi:hypothetical protein M5689_009967 [Euphorbia peplus]|nr:hypothetical protein M5689_009967 [Euphorbia peplus]